MIYIIGLGAADEKQIPVGIIEMLHSGMPLYLRTDQHPMLSYLTRNEIPYTSFDSIYERCDTFEEVYETIIEEVRKAGQSQDIIYAVPGHPCVAEYAVKVLAKDANTKIVGGQSFLDPMFAALQIDPIEGLQVMDALAMNVEKINTQAHVIIPQIFDQFVASEVKLDLMECYDDEHEVCLVHAAGSIHQKLTWKKLYELDHDFVLDNLLTLYVPPTK